MSRCSTCLRRWRLVALLLALAALAPAWSAEVEAPKKTKKGKKDKKQKKGAQEEIKKTKPFEWPDGQMGPRTSDRVSAGKRAAKYIACRVCEERTFGLLPSNGEVEAIDTFMEEQFSTAVGDVKELCNMRELAGIFKHRRLGIETSKDGSAKMVTAQEGKPPTYDEINTSELAFHWKSFALQHACMETFRKDGDAIASDLKKSYEKLRKKWAEEQGDERSELFKMFAVLIRKSCQKARTCKAQLKLQFREEL